MAKRRDLADLPADIAVSPPQLLAKAYRDYHRYSMTLRGEDPPVVQERDVLIAGKVVVIIPIDIVRQELVLIRQVRLPALASQPDEVRRDAALAVVAHRMRRVGRKRE